MIKKIELADSHGAIISWRGTPFCGSQMRGRVPLRVGERRTLAVLGKRLEKKALANVMSVVKPGTIRDSAGSL